jgi:hypothetical protein
MLAWHLEFPDARREQCLAASATVPAIVVRIVLSLLPTVFGSRDKGIVIEDNWARLDHAHLQF